MFKVFLISNIHSSVNLRNRYGRIIYLPFQRLFASDNAFAYVQAASVSNIAHCGQLELKCQMSALKPYTVLRGKRLFQFLFFTSSVSAIPYRSMCIQPFKICVLVGNNGCLIQAFVGTSISCNGYKGFREIPIICYCTNARLRK